MLQTIYWIAALLAGSYLFLLLLVYLFQSKLVYHPVSELPFTPQSVGLQYEEVYFPAEDGGELHGWFVPHHTPRGTVMLQHGNAGNISGRLETLNLLNRLGVNTFIYDYRGYGRSSGKPSEQGTYQDAMAAWNYLTEQRMTDPGSIVLMGRSLGGAITAKLAGEVSPAGVVLESTFLSVPDLAGELYPFFPARMMVTFQYSNKHNVPRISAPLLMMHSPEDELIPFEHGRRLYESAGEPKQFFELRGDHGNGFLQTGKPYVQALDRFFSTVLGTEKLNRKEEQ